MQIALITGCSSGIGRALAREMYRQGFTVYATARREETLTDLKTPGIRTTRLDVTNEENIRQVVDTILREEGKIDYLINNAGYGVFAPLLDVPEEELQAQFRTNVFAVLSLIQAVAPSMISAGGGTIVNIGSVSGVMPTPFAGAYCASKAALHALSDVLRLELVPFNIRVITVQPGAIQSRFGETATQITGRLVKKESVYREVTAAIEARARMSQENATPAEEFARKLVRKMTRPKLGNPVIRLGKKSRLLPFLKKWLPEKQLDKILSRKFLLDRLNTKK